jgi:tetratricopeptide (TPR) repeat protein
MHLLTFLLMAEAVVGGSLMKGAQPLDGGSVTLKNNSMDVSATVGADGKYSMEVPAGTYDVIVHRTIGGRKRTLLFEDLTVQDGPVQIDLFWPSREDAAGRSELVMQHFDAGKASFAAGSYEEAAMHFMEAVREDTSQEAAWGQLAVSQAMAGNFTSAEASYRSARAWGAGSATASNIANAYYRAGKFSEAGAKYKEAAEIEPSKAGIYLANAGAAYQAGHNMAEAESAYKIAAQVPGASPASWYFWGVCAQANGNRDDALTAFRGYLQAEGNGRYAADARQRVSALGG